MELKNVDHVELYVGDAQQTAFYLCAAFGFQVHGHGGPETGLAGQRSILLGQGGVRLLLTSGLTATHAATRYVARHGDGVACVAMSTDDAARAHAQALSRGAQPVEAPETWSGGGSAVVTAAVTGLGDVAHRFVERSHAGREFLPGPIEMLEPDPLPDGDLLTVVDHLALCTTADDLEPAVQRYRTIFGFDQIFDERIEIGDQAMDSRVVQSRSGGITLTLIAPDPAGRPGQLDDFLAAHDGPGVQHLAVGTQDIAAAVSRFGARGVRFLKTPAGYYDAVEQRLGPVSLPLEALRAGNILVDRDQWGEMYQIFTESTFLRRTFFLELIERRGALTFGSNNIQALYQAKERERTDSTVHH